jgi:hypothetical protein
MSPRRTGGGPYLGHVASRYRQWLTRAGDVQCVVSLGSGGEFKAWSASLRILSLANKP